MSCARIYDLNGDPFNCQRYCVPRPAVEDCSEAPEWRDDCDLIAEESAGDAEMERRYREELSGVYES